MNFSLIYTQKT